jgi:hypothetical protein
MGTPSAARSGAEAQAGALDEQDGGHQTFGAALDADREALERLVQGLALREALDERAVRG